MKKVLVVIVTYNAIPWIDKCLNSLVVSSIRPDVYVVDNGSTDGTQDFIKSRFPDVIFQQSCQNLGFGKANNIGLQYAIDNNFEYVYLLNQDAWLMPDTLEKLIDISSRNPDYGILSPFQMNADLMHIDRSFAMNTCSWVSNPNILSDIYNSESKDVYEVKDVMAAHWFITRDCLLKVGGFSPSFHHYAEDNNYNDRVRFWGMKIGIIPSLRVVHDRANRMVSKEKAIYLSYAQGIRKLSSPMNEFRHPIIAVFGKLMKDALDYSSFMPFMYFLKILLGLYSIRKNRRLSITKKCAFLRCDDIE